MSYTPYDFTRRDSRTDVYRDDRYTYWTDRWTDNRTYYNYNYYQRYDYSRDERKSRDRYSSRTSSSRSYSSRRRESREDRRHRSQSRGGSTSEDGRPRESSHNEVEHPEVPEAVFFPDLWSTHMTDADYAQMAAWEDETRQAIQAEIHSTIQSVNTKATFSPASPPRGRKRSYAAATSSTNRPAAYNDRLATYNDRPATYNDRPATYYDRQPLPKRPKIHVNRHFVPRYGYHY